MDISRWCKPPVTNAKMRRAPGGATECQSRDFRRPDWGLDSILATNRWFAPPANVQCPFGTTLSWKHPFTD